MDLLNAQPGNESWGVNNISVEYFGFCDGEFEFDSDGFKVCNIDQKCFDHLGTFMDGEGNLPVSSSCDDAVEDGDLVFNMNVQLLP